MLLSNIDTRHGTANQHSYSNGNTLPYTGVPFAMNYFCPQTTHQNGSWWFHPRDHTFQGIRLTHQPSPWMGDFSHLLLLPVSGAINSTDLFFNQGSYRPEEATFQPHYLSIYSERHRILTELTAHTYGAHIRFTFNRKDMTAGMLFTAPGIKSLTIKNNHLTGYISNIAGCEDKKLKMYIDLSFSTNIESLKYHEHNHMIDLGTHYKGEEETLYLSFDKLASDGVLDVQLATSFISQEQATLNLERELPHTFEEHKNLAADKWLNYLNRIEVSDKSKDKISLFYQMMYRCFLFPQTWYELDKDNQPIHYDTLSKTIKSGYYYTNNGFWDTCRSLFPLYSLIATEEYEKMLAGFYNAYKNSGYLPKWLSPDERGLMPGTLIDAVIADAAVKHIATDKMPDFLEAMLKSATTVSGKDNYGRSGTLDYLTYGYVPNHYHESVNHTQDYAYSDFCISQVAELLDDKDLAKKYAKQSLNYRNLIDFDYGILRSKDKDGQPRTPFNPYAWGRDYAEGSAYQNSFAAYHDFGGLIQSLGGKDRFKEIITDLCNTYPIFDVDGYGFEIHEMSEMAAIDFGQIAISNQPSFHLPFLFNYIAELPTTQHIVKELLSKAFKLGFDGYPGDEDNGSMSAWFVLNSLGFYPVTPGSGEYVIGIPIVDKAVIHLSNGNDLTIQTNNNVPQYHYSKNILRNNQPYNHLFFTHNDLMTGGNIEFDLCLVPPIKHYTETDLPFSLT